MARQLLKQGQLKSPGLSRDSSFQLPPQRSLRQQQALAPTPALVTGCCISWDAHHKMAGYTAQFILG